MLATLFASAGPEEVEVRAIDVPTSRGRALGVSSSDMA